jgi:hypothetical protein
VGRAQTIGTAQDLHIRYGPDMTNHSHVRILDAMGNNIDPGSMIENP